MLHLVFLQCPAARFHHFSRPLFASFHPSPLGIQRWNSKNHLKVPLIIAPASADDKSSFKKPDLMGYMDDDDVNGTGEYMDEDDFNGTGEENMDEIEDSPWEGAIIYKRSPSNTHLEYCTTLERLGMAHLSTHLSRSKASAMGLRVTSEVKDFPQGTPLQVSMTVVRKKNKWRLDGIIRTVLTLPCIVCDGGATKTVFLNFAMLLCDEAVVEPEMTRVIGPIEVKSKEDDEDIDWDDRLHFPPGQKEVDITKPIRDLVFLEDSLDAICSDPKCAQIAANNDSFYKFYL